MTYSAVFVQEPGLNRCYQTLRSAVRESMRPELGEGTSRMSRESIVE